jgi:hypothetical protein
MRAPVAAGLAGEEMIVRPEDIVRALGMSTTRHARV